MNKEFVSYEQALDLKELGFDELCICIYNREKSLRVNVFNNPNDRFKSVQLSYNNGKIPAPLYQQTFRWFRDKYNLIPDIQYYGNWNFEIFRIGEFAEPMDDVNVDYTFKGGTYEESELECLKKLIEIVKSK